MQSLSLLTSLVIGLCVVGLQAYAASAPNITTYQGRLLDANGVPVTSSSISMKFLLYTDLTAGTCVWSNSSSTCATTTARTVTLTSGLFTENLGDTAASPAYAAIPDSVFANNSTVYLEVQIGSETLSPRKQLVAAPYAMNAQTIDGYDSTALVKTSDTGSVSSTIIADGTIAAADIATGAITAPKLQAAATDLGAADVTVNFGNTNGAFNTSITTDGTITASSGFTGNLTGNVTGNLTGNVTGTVTGNAGSVTNGVYTTDTGTVTSTMIANGTITTTDIANNSIYDGNLADNTIDFDKIADVLTLDAATTITDGLSSNFNINLTSTGDFAIKDNGTGYFYFNDDQEVYYTPNLTTTNAMSFWANSMTSATALDLQANALTTGKGLSVSSSSGADTTADLINATATGQYTSPGQTVSGNILDASRSLDVNDGNGLVSISLSVTSPVATVSSNCFSTGNDVCVDSGNVLALTQSYGSASGAVLAIANAGSGSGIVFSGASTGTAIDASTALLTNALSIGANDIAGTTGNIDLTNFDVVGSTGSITTAGDIAVNGADLTTTGTTATLFNTTATTLSLGGAATVALNIGNGSGAYAEIDLGSGSGTHTINIAGTGATSSDTINIGTGGTAADTIHLGDAAVASTITVGNSAATGVSITDDNWSISSAGVANFVSVGATSAGTGAFTTLSSTGVTTIGNNSATVAINSSDWDINATGDMTNIGAVTIDGNFIQSAASISSAITATASTLSTGVIALVDTTSSANVGNAIAQSIAMTLTNYADDNAVDTRVGLDVTLTNNATDSGLNDSVSAIRINSMGGTNNNNGKESALELDGGSSDWDFNIFFNDTSTVLGLADGGSINWLDSPSSGAPNTLMTLTDAGTTGNLTLTGDIAVNGADLTTTGTSATLFNTAAATLSLGGASTTQLNIGNGSTAYTAINIGSAAAVTNLNIGNSANGAAQTISIGNGAAGANSTVSILSGVSTAGTQTLNLGAGSTAKTIHLGDGAGSNVITIGGGAGTLAIDTGDWDIGTTGNASGIGTLSADGAITFSVAGATSTPAEKLSGAWFTGGSATTTKPQLLVEPSTATSTAWSTNGTGIGINAASGFTGNLIDAQVNGTTEFSVTGAGNINVVGSVTNASGPLTINPGTYTAFGGASPTAATINGSVFASGNLEVDGGSYFDGAISIDNGGSAATGNLVDITTTTSANGFRGLSLDVTNTDDAGVDNIVGQYLSITNQGVTADDNVYGLYIVNASANAATDAMIYLTNDDINTAVTDGIFVNDAGGTMTDALDVSDAQITNAVNAGANFYKMDGIRFFEGTTNVLTFEDTSGNDLMTLTNNSADGDLAITGKMTISGNYKDGNYQNIGFQTGTSQDGDIRLLNLDLSSNLSPSTANGTDLIGARVLNRSITNQTNGSTVNETALSVINATATTIATLNDGNVATMRWQGASINLPTNVSEGNDAGDLTRVEGVLLTPPTSIISGSPEVYGVSFASDGASASWSAEINFADTDPVIQVADTGILTFQDDAVHSLMTLTDNGTTGDLATTGDLTVSGGDIIAGTTTMNLLNTTATTINVGGAANAMTIGNTGATGTYTFGNSTATNEIDIGSALTAATKTQTIKIGAGILNSTGLTAISIGNTNVSTGVTTVTIKAGQSSGGATSAGPSVTLGSTASTTAVCSSLATATGPTSGTAYELRDCSGAPEADYAEKYPTDAGVTYGDIMVPGTQTVTTKDGDTIVQLVKSSQTYQGPVAGIISNNYDDFTSAGNNINASDNPMPVALVGRVPVNVTSENGTIKAGDYLTTSSTPGAAMKATEVGRVIGMALSDFDGTSGQVMVQVNNSWFLGDIISSDGSSTVITDKAVMAPLGKATADQTSFDSYGFALRGSAWDGAQAKAVEMLVQTRVTDANNYRFSVRDTNDAEVAYITNKGTLQIAGDMVISGNLYPSDRGTAQTGKYIYYDGSEGAGGDFMRTNAKGWSTGSYDFAEMFPSNETLQPGEVVVFAGTHDQVERSKTENAKGIAGIVSTRPGFLAGENTVGAFPVALAGRVPTNVTADNGEINIGDALTTSKKPGFAMKAKRAGMVIGYALEPLASGDQSILVYVNAGYWGGEASIGTPGTNNQASQFASGQSADYTSLNMTGNVNLSGHDILNVGNIMALSGLWSIEADGTIKTESVLKTVITSDAGKKVETTAVTSPEAIITLSGTAKIENGQTEIKFADVAPDYHDVISSDAAIRVLVTPSGPVSLYVSEKDHDHFIVKQFAGDATGVEFDWMVTAYRKGFEPKVSSPVESSQAVEGGTIPAVSSTPPVILNAPEGSLVPQLDTQNTEIATSPEEPAPHNDAGDTPAPAIVTPEPASPVSPEPTIIDSASGTDSSGTSASETPQP